MILWREQVEAPLHEGEAYKQSEEALKKHLLFDYLILFDVESTLKPPEACLMLALQVWKQRHKDLVAAGEIEAEVATPDTKSTKTQTSPMASGQKRRGRPRHDAKPAEKKPKRK